MHFFIGHRPAASNAFSADDHSHTPPPPPPRQFDLSKLPLLLHVAEEKPLYEMAEKVNQSKIRQEMCHLLVP